MSGGSFNYASSAIDLEDALGKQWDLQQMVDALYGQEADDAAADLEGLLDYLRLTERRFAARLKRLQPVLHGLEWWQSGDWSEAQFRDKLATYRNTEERPASRS